MTERTHPMTLVETMEEIAAGLATVQAELDAEIVKGLRVRELRLVGATLAAARGRLEQERGCGPRVNQNDVLYTLGLVLEAEAKLKKIQAGKPSQWGRGPGRRR